MISVLAVDDQDDLLLLTKLYLETDSDIKVETVTSAHKALEQLQEQFFDVIVSDYQMPNMDGLAFLRTVKTMGIQKPFIIFTGRGREEIAIEALNIGADFYLQKSPHASAQFAELKNMIHQAVSRKRLESALLLSESNYRNLVESTDDSIYMVDSEGKYLFMNSYHKARLGIVDESFKLLNYSDFHDQEETEWFLPIVKKVYLEGNPVRDEYEHNGRTFLRTFSPVMNSLLEKPIAVTVISSEITWIKDLQKSYRELSAQYQSIIESTQDSIYSVDPDCKYLFMNSQHKSRIGIPDDSYIGKYYRDYHDSTRTISFEAQIREVCSTKKSLKVKNEQIDGDYIKSFCPVLDPKTQSVTSIIIISIKLMKGIE